MIMSKIRRAPPNAIRLIDVLIDDSKRLPNSINQSLMKASIKYMLRISESDQKGPAVAQSAA
jgi:hypothetical protein